MNITSYKLKDGRTAWRLRFEAAADPATGKRRRERETFTGSRRDAERRWRKRQAEIDAAGRGYAPPAKETLGSYLNRWLPDYAVKRRLKATTVASYRSLMQQHVIPGLGSVALADLRAAQIEKWEAAMLRKTDGRVKKNHKRSAKADGTSPPEAARTLSPKRVLNAHRMLNTALEEAVRLDLITVNPTRKVRPPAQDPRVIPDYTVEQVTALMKSVRGHRLESLFAVTWQTGMRMGELLALRWSDLDLDAGTARIRQTAATTGGPVFMQAAKTEASVRTIALPKQTVAVLRAQRARQAEERLKAGPKWVDRGLVFPTGKGTPMMPGSLDRTWHVFRARAGLPEAGFHALRHAYGCIALSNGVPLETVSENLGHTNIAFTKRTYAHLLLDAKQRGADIMSQVIAKTEGRP